MRKVDITDCNMTATSTALLFGSVPFNNDSIKELTLLGNNMIGPAGVTALKPFFKKASSLTNLVLGGINLGLEGIKLLSLELVGLPSLNHLHPFRNNIGDKGLEGITILCFSKLTFLNLGNNGIGRRGCEAIANLLRRDDSSLIDLNLQSNEIDDRCSEILAGSLNIHHQSH